jgi:NAD(P)-dependent dehydrogenase (short-subunit alcohol dehydrogenase family)
VLIDSIENSFDAESALLGSAALLSLARRGARVLAALRRGDREERLRRCSHVLGERVAFLNSSSSASSSKLEQNRSVLRTRRRRKEFKMLAGALKRLSEILKAFEHSESSLS